ncbi:NUDIX hydrolase [Frigoribacterium sp. 2-23]|uniref:NUDIX hydrolase n=1 Tax=Frigoribacterium sp. 2-23 TaxID=3415006 RepID=UPI003C6FED13
MASPGGGSVGAAAAPIVVSAVALIRDRRLLMVTSRGRDVLYLPGGKVEPGESAVAAAIREAREEISVDLAPESMAEAFTVTTQAHGEAEGRQVVMTLFTGTLADGSAEPTAAAEVDSVHWVTTADAGRCPPAGVATLEGFAARGLID